MVSREWSRKMLDVLMQAVGTLAVCERAFFMGSCLILWDLPAVFLLALGVFFYRLARR